ncbi:MAG TPA: protein kinase [Gaiellaceae bacterium]|nr:protein kinase [Gaiellaceae bacterium]
MVGETIANRYALEELVGTGGMSSVYRAHDTLLERDVALKLLHDYHGADASTIERFRREARAVAQLSHPNIVTVIDRGEDEGRQFIVFEYVAGQNLKELVEREGALPVRRALELAIEVGDGLAAAHRSGVVHRDVKPQNVLLNGDGRAKVTDFGIARSLEVEHGMTQTGTVLGTSNYIAPEQASGQPVDERTDVYSLGVVLFELLTGDVPFPGENFVAVALRHVHEPPPSVAELRPDVPLRVAGAVERALAKDPGGRFPTMAALVDELRACAAALAEPDAERTMIVPPPARTRPARAGGGRAGRGRRAWPVVLLVLGLAAVAALAAWALLDDSSPVREAVGKGGGGTATAAVALQAAASYDPDGDGQEHPEAVAAATDGDPSSYWTTERYQAFSQTKPGVGLVLDAGGTRDLTSIVVRSSTPGFTAEIRSGASSSGPFDTVVSPSRTVGERTAFPVDGDAARYYVLWLTELPGGVARVTEVTARGQA